MKPIRIDWKRELIRAVSLCTLGSGLFDLFSLVRPRTHLHTRLLLEVFPIEFIHLSRFLTLVLGFALAVSSLHLFRRKRRAYYMIMVLLLLSVALHLTKGLAKGLEFEHLFVSLIVLGLLFVTRRSYTVASVVPRWRTEGPGLLVALLLALAYGVAGFWLLDRREFGLNFTFGGSLHRTLRFLSLVADPQIVPQTRHAKWFVDSLSLTSVLLLGYVLVSIFRPALYRFRTLPREQAMASSIVEESGRSAVDYFKVWPDKSYLFSPSHRSFVAYRVGGSFAVALGDPVGPEEELEPLVRRFLQFCHDNDWRAAFHQTLPDLLPIYGGLGLKKLKIGDEAIVDLRTFDLNGKERKGLRHKVNQLESAGIRTRFLAAPVPEDTLSLARGVSDAWLTLPGRRERTFTLGRFDMSYLRSTPLFLVEDQRGQLQAFANLIPSYVAGETTIDLMRHRPDAPNGTMDYLFIKLFAHEQERGFSRFNLGLAPMSGFQEREAASAEERAVHHFFQSMNFLFSYQGLRQYKAKFASSWEPRYAVFKNRLDLPLLALALNSISSVGSDE